MRIYFSGGRGLRNVPENLMGERKPHVMLTFLDMENNGTLNRFNLYMKRRINKQIKRKKTT